MLNLWIISLTAWLPIGGIAMALLLFDITGGNEESGMLGKWQSWHKVGRDADL